MDRPGRGSDRHRLSSIGAELLGLIAAAAIACLVLGLVAGTARSWVLFSDGDTVLPALVANSLRAGQRQDWMLSTVLFLPELGQFLLLSLLGLSSRATMALNAVVNFTLLFVSIRMAAGALLPTRTRRMRILVALAAFALVVLPALTDTSASRDSLELPSQLGTATYYAWTLLVIPATLALAVWSIRTGRRGGRPWGALIALVLVTAGSVLNNPLHLIWTAAPLLVLLVLAAAIRRLRWRLAAAPAIALVAGCVAGMLGRTAFAGEIGLNGLGYFHPGRFGDSAAYYSALLTARAGTAGILELLVWLGGAVLGVVTALRCLRAGRSEDSGGFGAGGPGALVTAAFAGLVPFGLVFAVVYGGTNAARYLGPVWVLPALALLAAVAARSPGAALVGAARVGAVAVGTAGGLAGGVAAAAGGEADTADGDAPDAGAASDVLPARRRLARSGPLAVLATAVFVLAAGVPGGAMLAAGSQRVDPDLACAVSWVNHAHRTGAGQYWTIRPVKALVRDPTSLVQVTGDLRPYWWIVNRADFTGARVTFLVSGADQAFAPELTADAKRIVQCGRYQIADFGTDHSITLTEPPSV